EADPPDLGDLRHPRGAACGLEVDDAEGGLVHARRGPAGRRQPDEVATAPSEARVSLDDLRHQTTAEPLRALAHAEDLGDDVSHLEGPPAPGEEHAEPVGQRLCSHPGLRSGEGEAKLHRAAHSADASPEPRTDRRYVREKRRGRLHTIHMKASHLGGPVRWWWATSARTLPLGRTPRRTGGFGRRERVSISPIDRLEGNLR